MNVYVHPLMQAF